LLHTLILKQYTNLITIEIQQFSISQSEETTLPTLRKHNYIKVAIKLIKVKQITLLLDPVFDNQPSLEPNLACRRKKINYTYN